MNEFEAAVASHVSEDSADGVTDVCFAAGWGAALDSVLRLAGNGTANGGPIGSLRAQARDYETDCGTAASSS